MHVCVCVFVLKKYMCCASAINYEKQMIMQQTLKADLWLQLSPSLPLLSSLCVCVCVISSSTAAFFAALVLSLSVPQISAACPGRFIIWPQRR